MVLNPCPNLSWSKTGAPTSLSSVSGLRGGGDHHGQGSSTGGIGVHLDNPRLRSAATTANVNQCRRRPLGPGGWLLLIATGDGIARSQWSDNTQ